MKKQQLKLRKNKYQLRVIDIVILIIVLIILNTFFIIKIFNNYINPKILSVANIKINKMTNVIINQSFDKDVLKKELINNIITVNLNNQNEIIGADFNYEKIYELAKILTNKLNENFEFLEKGRLDKFNYYDDNQVKIDKQGYIMALPIGIASNNALIANLGPKIPVRVKFIETVLTEVKTKITDYGINNALLEVYLELAIERQIITPVVEKISKISYSLPITSKIIYGKIPNFYAGIMETKSGNLNIPITE